MSLDAEQAQPPSGRGAGTRALAAIAVSAAALALAACSAPGFSPAAALASFTNTPASETISLVNGAGSQAYPIINYEYAVVRTAQASPVRAQDLRAFLTWAITSGIAQLARVNFEPLPPSIVTLSTAQIAKIKG